MSNPKIRVPHKVTEIMHAAGMSPAQMQKSDGMLTDVQRYLEDAIGGGLRKTISTFQEGSGGSISTAYPSFVAFGNNVFVTFEKMWSPSRLEVDISVDGSMGAGSVHFGARCTSGGVVTVQRIGYITRAGAAVVTASFSGSVPALAEGTYTVELVCGVTGTTWGQTAGSTNSIRVTESLW